jgi:hypothetical protein
MIRIIRTLAYSNWMNEVQLKADLPAAGGRVGGVLQAFSRCVTRVHMVNGTYS